LVEMGERGYERAKKLFSVERMVENTISLYNKLLEEKGLKTFQIEFGQKQK